MGLQSAADLKYVLGFVHRSRGPEYQGPCSFLVCWPKIPQSEPGSSNCMPLSSRAGYFQPRSACELLGIHRFPYMQLARELLSFTRHNSDRRLAKQFSNCIDSCVRRSGQSRMPKTFSVTRFLRDPKPCKRLVRRPTCHLIW